jgi:outer membrane murein-binding lipoprotein Lpp
MNTISRRRIIKNIAVSSAAILSSPNILLAGCSSNKKIN